MDHHADRPGGEGEQSDLQDQQASGLTGDVDEHSPDDAHRGRMPVGDWDFPHRLPVLIDDVDVHSARVVEPEEHR